MLNDSFRDTVSSVGLIKGQSFPDTVGGMHQVCVFRHALALDDFRVKFLPEFVKDPMKRM